MVIDTISIMSCDRNPSYLEKTISTIPNDFNIEIFYQGDISKLYFENIKIYSIKYVDDKKEVHKNSQFNYASTLLRSKCGLVIEDDIHFSDKFTYNIDYITAILENTNINRYAVALYSCYEWGSSDFGIVNYPIDNFYGTQAMLYDLHTAREFGHFLMGRIGVEPYDLALKSFINQDNSTKLFASTRSIVQHIGEHSSGLGFFHQSANFSNL